MRRNMSEERQLIVLIFAAAVAFVVMVIVFASILDNATRLR